VIKQMEEFQAVGKERFEAVAAATAQFSKGMQEVMTEAAEQAREGYAGAVKLSFATLEKLLQARSVEEAIRIQSEAARTAQESVAAQSRKSTDLFAKYLNACLSPLAAASATDGARRAG